MNKIAVVFPGQGSQFPGMGKSLYQQFKTAREVYKEAEDVLKIPLRRICFEGSVSELNRLACLFPAVITYGIASYKVFCEMTDIRPEYMAGHSLGEYSALVCSGVISFYDALKIAEKRAKLSMRLTNMGTMTVVDGLTAEMIKEKCEQISQNGKLVYVSCYNTETQTVISGHSDGVRQLEDEATKLGAIITPMFMMPPFHCPLMLPIIDEFKKTLETISYKKGDTTVIDNVSGLPFKNNEFVKNLSNHLMKPVFWYQSVKYLQLQGVDTTIEMGAHNYLSSMIANTFTSCSTYSYGQNHDWTLSTMNLDASSRVLNMLNKSIEIAVSTKNYAKKTTGYDENVMYAYRELESLLVHKGSDDEKIVRMHILLNEIFDLKQLPTDIRRELIQELNTHNK